MVREEKVKLMSRIAIYEKNKGKTEIPMNGYYKGDYVRLHTLKAIVSATVTFILIAVLIVVYKIDFLLDNVFKVEYKMMTLGILALYVVWIFVYWIAARIFYAHKYNASKSNIIIYNHNLKKLQEAADKEGVNAKGGVVISDDFVDF